MDMKRSIVLCIVLFLLAAGAPAPLPAASQTARPNVILILTDDLDAKAIAHMPRLRAQLADRGVTFANFFVTTSLCCPSRSSILRGQYVHNHHVYTNQPPRGGFETFRALGHERSTVATWLQAAGYRTVLMGKYLNGYPDRTAPTYVPPGWEEWYSPSRGGYANFNYTMNENGRLVAYGSRPEDYMTDVLARKAADVIRRSGRDGKPFFIYLATYAPHAPATPAPRHANAFTDVTAPRPPSFNEADVSDKPGWVQQREALSAVQVARIDEQYRTRLRSLLAVDEMIEAMIDVLRQTGQLDRTYLFFTSDNGFHMGEHRLMPGKNTAFEEDIHVPLLVRGPGVPAGRVVDALVLNIDLAPTFAALARAQTPSFVDGRSLTGWLGAAAPPGSWRDAFAIEHYNEQPRNARQARPARQIPEFAGLRMRSLVYVEYETGELELYDFTADPYQLNNLAAGASRELIARLSARLAALRACRGQNCLAAEDAGSR